MAMAQTDVLNLNNIMVNMASPSNITTHPSAMTTTDSTTKMTRIVKNAELPPKDTSLNESIIFDRHLLHGGPVTVATIRFPPPKCCIVGINKRRDNSSPLTNNYNDDEYYNSLKSRGRIVFARGPWIESHPIFPCEKGDGVIEKKETLHEKSGVGSTKSNFNNGNGKTTPCNEKESYKILSFGGGASSDGSSTFEGVHGMIFPSSSSSLAYLKSSPPNKMEVNSSPKKRMDRRASSLISVVAYGGRRISFFRGGGLWSTTDESKTQKDNNFVSISITKSNNEDHATKCTNSSYLEVSDWIHDVRLLDTSCSNELFDTSDQSKAENCKINDHEQGSEVSFLIAMGMANNNCEIWGFHMTASVDGRKELILFPTQLQCITCDVRCMTYSLSFYGWDNAEMGVNDDGATLGDNSIALPSLVAASGTVFGEILVWGVANKVEEKATSPIKQGSHLDAIAKRWRSDTINKNNSPTQPANAIKTLRIRVTPSYCLKGHLGSVFCVKFCGNYIASTSDDRSVRLWALAPGNQDTNKGHIHAFAGRTSAKKILEGESTHTYSNIWTGWGHTARVWDVTFASSSSNKQIDSSFPLLVSAGEDSTARIWSPLASNTEISYPLRGHRCESLWRVDVCEGIIVTGGNDGCVKLFDLESRVRSKEESVKTFCVPKDPIPIAPVTTNGEAKLNQPLLGRDAENSSASTMPRKKRKKKSKPNGQAIFGMEFYGSKVKVRSNLLVATRAGGLFSLDLISHIWTDHSSWSGQVVSSSNNGNMISINSSSGSCIGVHPSGEGVVVGTSEGWLVTVSLSKFPSTEHHHKKIAFHATSHRSVQSVSFINDESLLVFYARGSVIWFKFGESPIPLHVMKLSAAGIPLSFAYDEAEQAMYIGDSRGNISFFNLTQPCWTIEDSSQQRQDQTPNSILIKAHGKEHVTGLTVLKSTGAIISVGNDGCLHQCIRDKFGKLQKMISIPIPNVTGLRNVWNVSHPNGEESVILGGFLGNDFVLLDSINGYEFLRIPTGGRQRRRDFFFSFPSNTASFRCPNIYGMANLTGHKDGCSEIDFHLSESIISTLASMDTSHYARGNIQTSYSIGSPVHAETINDACWVECAESIYLLTGSNDCTVRLSKLENNKFVSAIELPPHESCVRGVCSSRRPNADSSLIVTCGGKLSMEVYIFNASPETSKQVSLLCSYRILGTASIDHRMNAVRATPLHPHEKQCHLVLSGDSDGNLHLCVVSEQAAERRTTIGTILQGNGRPVLCLELLRCFGKIFAVVGTTGGEISVWAFPSSINLNGGDSGVPCLEGVIPTSPIYTFKAHQTGVNDLSVVLEQKGSVMSGVGDCSRTRDKTHSLTNGDFSVMIGSVGDDQALSVCVLDFKDRSQTSNGSFYLKGGRLLVIQSASASALKAVTIVPDGSFYRIYTTGHGEQITLWHINPSELSIKYISSSPLGTEGSCITWAHHKQPDGSLYEVVAIGGEGVELLSLDLNCLHAAIKLREANYLLITTGAGFSADSGLMTYECAPAEYRDMCNPVKLADDPHHFQQFWLKFAQSYLETKPHKGYALLDQWCHGGKLQHLKRPPCKLDEPRQSLASPWWVYTSNVDGHFRLLESFLDSSCEIHGNCLEFKCASGIGYSNGEPRIGNEWDQWNQKMTATNSCKQATVQMNQELLTDIGNSDELLTCSHCRQPMRPNVLMFHDTDENVLKEIYSQRERYQTWESLVEEKVATNGGKFVILEMGCGVNVPAVRQESEEVLLDCAKEIQLQPASDGSVCMIRINPKDAKVEMSDDNSFEVIPIASKAASALQKIDFWLEAFAGR